jgi:hypothetical protein
MFGLFVAMFSLAGFYMHLHHREVLADLGHVSTLIGLSLVTVILCTFSSHEAWQAEVVPLLVFAMTVAIAFDADLALLLAAEVALVVVVGLGHGLAAQGGAGTGPILDDDGLPQPLAQALRQQPRHQVGGAAGRIGHHEPDGLAGEAFSATLRTRECRGGRQRDNASQNLAALRVPGHVFSLNRQRVSHAAAPARKRRPMQAGGRGLRLGSLPSILARL